MSEPDDEEEANPARSSTRRRRGLTAVSDSLARLAFLAIHGLGGVGAVETLRHTWDQRVLLTLLADAHLGPGTQMVWSGLTLLVLATAFAMVAVGRIIWRWRRRQPEPDIFLRLRALFFVVVGCVCVAAFVLSTPESFKGPFRVRHPIVAEIAACVAYAGYVTWCAFLPLTRRMFPKRARRVADLICLNAAVLLVLGEIGLRIVAAVRPTPILITEATPSPLRRGAGRLSPGSLRFGFPVNQGGHYDAEFVGGPDAKRPLVVSIGDSFSQGVVPHLYHFTTVAEREYPGLAVYNMGYPALGPADYRHLLERQALPLQPDLVVIQLFLGNDVTDGVSPAGEPRWYDADNYLMPVVWHRLQIAKQAELTASFAAVAPSYAGLVEQYPWLEDPLLEQPSFSEDIYLKLERMAASNVCAPPPGLYENFFDNLAALKRAAGRVPVAFVLIPDEFQVEDDLWQRILALEGRPLDRDLPQREVVRWMGEHGIPVLDLLPVLRAAEPLPDGQLHLYHVRDTHFNARGNQLAGQALAGFVRRLLTIGPTPLHTVPLPLELDLGAADRDFLLTGWSHDEVAGDDTFVWSTGLRSALALPLPRSSDVRMGFEVSPFEFPGWPGQRVSVVVDGEVLEEIPLHPGKNRYFVILPKDALSTPRTTIELRYAYARTPKEVIAGSPDTRELSVAWYSIDFAEANQ